jgi:hypothetical protein
MLPVKDLLFTDLPHSLYVTKASLLILMPKGQITANRPTMKKIPLFPPSQSNSVPQVVLQPTCVGLAVTGEHGLPCRPVRARPADCPC